MAEDKTQAARLVQADLGSLRRQMTEAGGAMVGFNEIGQAPDDDSPRKLLLINIGTRDNLTTRAAEEAAEAWRTLRARYPNAAMLISIAGYDDDPRELWEFPEVCRFVRRWAKAAGIPAVPGQAAMAMVPPADAEQSDLKEARVRDRMRGEFTVFLAACGVFGPELQSRDSGEADAA